MGFVLTHINKTVKIIFTFIVFSVSFLFYSLSFAQGPCDPNTPVFNIDFTGNPNGTWLSNPAVPRAGNCCGTAPPNRCIEFIITLDPGAAAINFQIASGAIPGGAMFYQIGCGPPTAVGTAICLNGPGPHILTFCKPGNNPNTYKITSIGGAAVSPDDTVGYGCSATIVAKGFIVNSSLMWNSIFPGTLGNYNSYLSCTNTCLTTVVTSGPGLPPFIDFQVCGSALAALCLPSASACDTIRVYFPPPLLSSINPNPASFCANNNSGVLLTGNASGGDPPYTYAWTSSSGSLLGTGLTYTATAAGNYNFNVYDHNYPACPAPTSSVIVSITPPPTINAGTDKIICDTFVSLNGTVTFATGGIWSGGAGAFIPNNTSVNTTYTPTLAERLAGIVILTFTSTGNGGCSEVSDQIIISIPPPIDVTISGPPAICFGQTATITANVSGGTPPFNYLWNTGAITQTISNVQAGLTYSVTVSDASPLNCSDAASISIPQNPNIIINTSIVNAIPCNTTAIISASATGGTGVLTYLWSNGATTTTTTVNTGTYTMTVTDAMGCSAAAPITINPTNSVLVVSVNQPALLCNNGTTTLTANTSGGSGGVNYSWSTGAISQSIVAGAGNYCVNVTDASGCIASACAVITESPAIIVTIPAPAMVCNGSATAVNANVIGGQPPYTYVWNTGETSQSITKPTGTYTLTVTDAISCVQTATVSISQEALINISTSPLPVACFGGNTGSAAVNVTGGIAQYYYSWLPYGGSTATANALVAGTYTVNVTDNIGCSKTATIIITEPAAALTASISVLNNTSCNGGGDGAASVNTLGGTATYLYAWSPSGASGQTANTLSAGLQTVTITDINGCAAVAQANISEPITIAASIVNNTPVSCNGGNTGSASVLVSGGTPGYSYAWSPSGGTNATASNLVAGTYTLTITDITNCITQITVIISQPAVLSSTISSNNITCNGLTDGTATANPSGGTGPYFYAWSTSPAQTTPTASNLAPGTYTLTVTDSKACNTSNNFTIIQPTLLSLSTSPSISLLCNASSTISALASGGTASYTYLWSTGQTTTSIIVNAGAYSVTATDGAGCTNTGAVNIGASNSTLTVVLNQPANLCFGATTVITASASNGEGDYSYLWNTGLTDSSITVGAGSYCITITDSLGCLSTACATINQNPLIEVSINAAPIICSGATDTISADGLGGQTPYFYSWNSGETTQWIIKPAGTYIVTLSDIIGGACFAKDTITIIDAPLINTTMSSTNVSCFGANNGSGLVYVSGGTPSYSYLWLPSGDTTAYVSNLIPGTYTVLVTDSIGCTKPGNITVTEPLSAVAITFTISNNLCFGDSAGTLTAIGNGGTPPYNYFWTANADTNSTITGLKAGVYNVIVVDSTSCYTNASATITDPPDILLIGSTVPSTCNNNNGSATVSAISGPGTLSYLWATNPPQITATANNLLAGNYTVTVNSSNGCSRSLDLTVAASNYLDVNFASDTACLNIPVLFTDSSSGSSGSTITSWAWDFGNSSPISNLQNPTYTFTASGIYMVTLTVTSSIGCVSSITKPVSFYTQPSADFLVVNPCENAFTQFTNTSVVFSDSIVSWNWNFGDATPIEFTQNPSHIYNPAGDYDVSLVVTTKNGCFDTITKSTTIYPLPNVQFTVIDTSGCAPFCSQFMNTSIPTSDTVINWLWDFGDGTSFSGTNTSLEHCYSVPGSYTITLTETTSHGCSSTAAFPNLITVFSLPVAAFNYSPQPASTDAPEIKFHDLSVGASAWQWTFDDLNDLTASNLQFPTHLYSDSGYYCPSLIVQNIHSCFDTIVNCFEITAGFTFYIPNSFTPNGDATNESFSGFGTFISQYDMWIFDRWGNMIFHTDNLYVGWDGKANKGKEIAQIDVYVYLVELKDLNENKHTYRGTVTLVK